MTSRSPSTTATSPINTASIHWQAGDFATVFGNIPALSVDDTTLKVTFAKNYEGETMYDTRWAANLMNDAGRAFSVQSLNRYYTVGKTEMRDTTSSAPARCT